MKRKHIAIIIIVLIVLVSIIYIGFTKKISEVVSVSGKTALNDNAVRVRLDKSYTFKDYNMEETEDGIIITIRFKLYEEK